MRGTLLAHSETTKRSSQQHWVANRLVGVPMKQCWRLLLFAAENGAPDPSRFPEIPESAPPFYPRGVRALAPPSTEMTVPET
jgi:hypothetical protein